MSEPSDENLGLFADVISGTLGIVVLIALILALSALDQNGLDVFVPRTLRVSAALENHLEVARAARNVAETDASAALERAADARKMEPAAVWSAALTRRLAALPAAVVRPDVDVGTDPQSARLRESLLLGDRIGEAEVAVAALDRLLASLGERQERASAAFADHFGHHARVLEESKATQLLPLYIICRGDRMFATRLWRDGAYRRNSDDLSWLDWEDGKRSRCFFQEDQGWTAEQWRENLRSWTPILEVGAGWNVVLLVQPDAYELAREVMAVLAPTGVPFSWMPYPAGDQIDFAVDGRVPPGPL